jgi:hypothetical protein
LEPTFLQHRIIVITAALHAHHQKMEWLLTIANDCTCTCVAMTVGSRIANLSHFWCSKSPSKLLQQSASDDQTAPLQPKTYSVRESFWLRFYAKARVKEYKNAVALFVVPPRDMLLCVVCHWKRSHWADIQEFW